MSVQQWRLLLIGVLGLSGVACQTPPAARGPAVVAPEVAADARAALARRDWSTAAPLFRLALRRDPHDVALHYGLAVCATYLESHDEATREFRWILQHAPASAEEAQIARTWLGQTEAPGEATDDPTVGGGAVSGMVMWGLPGDPRQPREHQLVLLQGIPGTPTKGLFYRTRTDGQGRYEFTRVVPGPYKVTDAMAGPVTWRVRIAVDPVQPTVLDLTPDNTVEQRDDFPAAAA
jgi:hypothetical protein